MAISNFQPTFQTGPAQYQPYWNPNVQVIPWTSFGQNVSVQQSAQSGTNTMVAFDFTPFSTSPAVHSVTASLTFSKAGTGPLCTYPVQCGPDQNYNSLAIGSPTATLVSHLLDVPTSQNLFNFANPLVGFSYFNPSTQAIGAQTFVAPWPIGFDFDTVLFQATANGTGGAPSGYLGIGLAVFSL